MKHIAYIALGSNLGNRRANIESALAALGATDGVRIANVSSPIETEPVGPPNQGRYLNGAAKLITQLAPRALLNRFLEIESQLGRQRVASQRNGPRTIDIDLLLYDDLILDEPGLSVPHPRMHERGFVLMPLAEIAADAKHPLLDLNVRELLGLLPTAPAEQDSAAACLE